MRLTIHVRPRSGATIVGGDHGGALVVRVSAPAVDGRANRAVAAALADAFDVAPRGVTIVAGARSRRKLVEIEGDGPELAATAARLLRS